MPFDFVGLALLAINHLTLWGGVGMDPFNLSVVVEEYVACKLLFHFSLSFYTYLIYVTLKSSSKFFVSCRLILYFLKSSTLPHKIKLLASSDHSSHTIKLHFIIFVKPLAHSNHLFPSHLNKHLNVFQHKE